MPVNYWEKKIKLYKTDLSLFKLCKSKISHSCFCCNKNIPKGSYLYGENYTRICINCAKKFFENSINKLKDYIELIKKAKENLEENKEEYKLNNLSANI